MNHLKTLLIFLVLFGVLALYRESIKTNIMRQREEKKNADYNNINPETENFVSEIENDNYHYVPKKIYTRGTGINENGYNFNYEGSLRNECPYKWNNENLGTKWNVTDASYEFCEIIDKKSAFNTIKTIYLKTLEKSQNNHALQLGGIVKKYFTS